MLKKLELAAAWLVVPALAMWLSAGPEDAGPWPGIRLFGINTLTRLVLVAAAVYMLVAGYWLAAVLIGALLVLLAVVNAALFHLLSRQRRVMRENLRRLRGPRQ